MKHFLHTSFGLLAMTLAACGGSDKTKQTDTALPPDPVIEPATTSLSTIDTSTVEATQALDSLNLGASTLDFDEIAAALAAGETTLNLPDGGTADLTTFGNDTAFVTAQLADGSVAIGVYGALTQSMPMTGNATYVGTGSLSVNDGAALYDLTGTSNTEARFDDGTLVATVTDLAGTLTDGAGAVTAGLIEAGTLTLIDADISGNSFSGGSVAFQSNVVGALLTQTESVTSAGSFHGEDAAEIGGAIAVDDTQNGTLQIIGTFAGAKQ